MFFLVHLIQYCQYLMLQIYHCTINIHDNIKLNWAISQNVIMLDIFLWHWFGLQSNFKSILLII